MLFATLCAFDLSAQVMTEKSYFTNFCEFSFPYSAFSESGYSFILNTARFKERLLAFKFCINDVSASEFLRPYKVSFPKDAAPPNESSAKRAVVRLDSKFFLRSATACGSASLYIFEEYLPVSSVKYGIIARFTAVCGTFQPLLFTAFL